MFAPDLHVPPQAMAPVSIQVSRGFEHFPPFDMGGTGGIADVRSIVRRHGYYPVVVSTALFLPTANRGVPDTERPSAACLMQEVQDGFGRTFSHLPAIFGVSRQTLYNWLKGENPKEIHLPKLKQLAAAAQVFAEQRVKVTAQALNRRLDRNLSFIELLAQGADGKSMAERLIRLEATGQRKRRQLSGLLGNAEIRDDEPDLIRKSFDELA